ncbi:hypothetical protein F8388_021961 [Cannabis sativa]|uniref:Uncharacterized protein n=1 Tax=Cannabis sativa TaxID=3483 RepID=A0A7J6DUT2_CANSA|nr:hypothetical protein F8388_021961 [Cannabis sativa]KAF4371004.1 hypothetical protein G4B88_031321 [Cannabis sativa]
MECENTRKSQKIKAGTSRFEAEQFPFLPKQVSPVASSRFSKKVAPIIDVMQDSYFTEKCSKPLYALNVVVKIIVLNFRNRHQRIVESQ